MGGLTADLSGNPAKGGVYPDSAGRKLCADFDSDEGMERKAFMPGLLT